MTSSVFEATISAIIILNCVLLGVEGASTAATSNTEVTFTNILEIIFFILYLLEMSVKIIAFGFLFNRGAYLRDPWNALDFMIVVASIISLTQTYLNPDVPNSSSINFSSLRTFRILRPLRTINAVKKLRTLVETILNSIPYLLDIFLIILLSMVIFSVTGLQLFPGDLLQQCFDPTTGRINPVFQKDLLCGGTRSCQPGYICGKIVNNPVSGIFSLDSFHESYLTVFVIITTEGWSSLSQYLIYASSAFSVVFSIAIISIETWFLHNLLLAIISAKFNEAQDKQNTIQIQYRNQRTDKIISRCLKENIPTGHTITSAEGVALQKMLLYNPERYKLVSTIQSLQCGYSPSGIYDYLLRPFHVLRDELYNESVQGLELLIERIKQAEFLDKQDPVFFNRRREEFAKLRDAIPLSSRRSSNGSQTKDKSTGKIKSSIVESEYEEICDVADLNPDGPAQITTQLKLLFDRYRPQPAIKGSSPDNQGAMFVYRDASMASKLMDKSSSPSRNNLHSPLNSDRKWQEPPGGIELKGDFGENGPQAENLSEKSEELARPKLNDSHMVKMQHSRLFQTIHDKKGSSEWEQSHNPDKRKDDEEKSFRLDQLIFAFPVDGNTPSEERSRRKIADAGDSETRVTNHHQDCLFPERLNNNWRDYVYWENIEEYNCQSYNHFAKLKEKSQSVKRKKTSKEIMDIEDFDNEERAHRDYLETLQTNNIIRDACLRYQYDPEACFNSATDVLKTRYASEELFKPSSNTSSELKQHVYSARAYAKKTDSLWQPGEFPRTKRQVQILRDDSVGEQSLTRGQLRRIYRQRWYHQTAIMRKKPFFPLNKRNDTLAMIERNDYRAGKYDRDLDRKRKKHQETALQRLDSMANEEFAIPQISDDERAFRIDSVRVNPNDRVASFSNIFLKDFSEVDTKHLLEDSDSEAENNYIFKKRDLQLTMENHDLYNGIHWRDSQGAEIEQLNWSGEQVCHPHVYREGKTDKVLSSLNHQDLLIWLRGYRGCYITATKYLENFIFSKAVDRFVTFCILLNTVILTLDGLISQSTADIFDKVNTVLTFVFLLETMIKIMAVGFKRFFSNFNFVFELSVTTISLVELIFILNESSNSNQASALSGFRSLRILRMFRVLRVARILQELKFMKVIVAVIVESAEQYAYVGLIMLLFIFIYALLGMQIYGGNLIYKGQIPRMNFDSLTWSFVALFQLLTIENWTDILQTLYASSVSKTVSLVYVISWIIIGNYIFFNLFLALLLGGFDSDEVIKQLEENQDEYKELEEVALKSKSAIRLREARAIDNARRSGERLQLLIRGGNYDLVNDDEQVLNALGEEELKHRAHYLVTRKYVDEDSTEEELLMNFLDKKLKENEQKAETEAKDCYIGVQCAMSLNLLTKSNPIRLAAAKLVAHRWFESTIFFLIMISSLKLVAETYLDDEGSSLSDSILSWLDLVITILFGLESLAKILRNGFFWDEGSYLRDPWSCLDFFIVTTSLIDLALTNVNLPIIKIFRTLRPLRFVRRYENMRVIISSLVGVIGPLMSVVLVILLVWLIFAILAMNFVGNKLSYCDITDYYGVSQSDCLAQGANWKRSYWNFDNVFESFVTLFVLTSLEGWPNVMGTTLDAADIDGGPPIYNNYKWMILYYLIFILVSSLFLLDLFTGVIFYQYGVELERESAANSNNCTQEQIKWIMIQKLVYHSKPEFDMTKPAENRLSRACFKLIQHWLFEVGMMAAILVNVVLMCLYYQGMSKSYQDNLEQLNQIISWIFVGEFLVKFVALNLSYFKDSWNNFDFAIVLLGLVDFGLSVTGSDKGAFGWAPQIAKGFRALRVLRITKLLKNDQLEGIRRLIKTLAFSLPSIINVFALLLMTYFIFAVVACFLFRGAKLTSTANNDNVWNFNNFHMSLWLLFRCSTGEDWPTVMYNYGDGDGLYAASRVFFVVFTIMTTFVILNLVDLVVVQIFENTYFDPDNALEMFEQVKKEFNPAWNIFTHRSQGKGIHYLQMLRLFSHLE